MTVDVSMPHQAGKTILVHAGESVQEAIDRANCGDTIELQAGATFVGKYNFPGKPCDDVHWIVLRTSATDAVLPPPGTRLTPCYSGVSSLPGRPDLHCSSTKVVTAELQGRDNQGPITFGPGANHYRFIGLELTRAPASPRLPIVYQIAAFTKGAPADHIIFDRVWAHGTAQDETAHGVRFNSVSYAAVVDSTFTDFHCVAISGSCTDAQAISGGNGALPAGPFLIEDNFLEASGENIMFGGAPGTVTPTDITIRRNHLFKPLTWHRGEPGYVGGKDGKPFIVKNNFELKVGTRVLFEYNILDYSWGGFTQAGFAILLSPRNIATQPSTQVTDITIRYCLVRHSGSGMQIFDPTAKPAASVAGERYSIHDVVFDDLDHLRWEGHGNLAQISMSPKPDTPVLQHVKIDHVTAFPKHVLVSFGGPFPPQMSDFTFTNNLVSAGEYAIHGIGSICSDRVHQQSSGSILDACFQTFVFKNNVIFDSPPMDWPKGNFIVKNAEAAGITKFNGGNGGNYRLLPSSRFRGKATDELDIGADVEAIDAGIRGVE